ncbi:MAG TPA: type II toxin-antitoxin system PemK/MazF family toxin [Bryobacteraceae bacterium]|jgi:mRNA interferase MazF
MKRGEIYWCDLEPRRGHEQGARRPVIIISADPYNASQSPLIGVVPLTSAAAKNPVHVRLTQEETGMDTDSVALTDHARFLDRTRLHPTPAGRLTPEAQLKLDRNLARVMGL